MVDDGSMKTITRKLVFLFPGFEPLTPQVHERRFETGTRIASECWGIDFRFVPASPALPSEPDATPRSEVRLSGPGWQTESEIVICDWSDTIALYGSKPAWTRLLAGLGALADFAVTGTAVRYFRTSWRYGLFFLYPIVLLLFALALTIFVATLPWAIGASAWQLVWSLPLAAALLAAMSRHGIRRLHFLTLMDDWAFARDLAHGTSAAIEARVAIHARAIENGLGRSDVEEVIVAGHSLGVGLAVLALDRALSRTAPKVPVHVLSVGASLLKTALHPAATAQRAAVRSLVEGHRLPWVDVQSLSDPLNFYRSNPARSLGIEGGRAPVVHRISLGKLVSERNRRRNRLDFFRRHRQFVYGTERRHPYSFHLILAGPVEFERYAETGSIDVPPLAASRPATPDVNRNAS